MVLPEIPENFSMYRLFNTRKNLRISRNYDKFKFLRGIRFKQNDIFLQKTKPGLFFGKKINSLINNDITIRYIPQVEFNSGFMLFPNLEEYNVTPGNLTEQY
jgi:hypothetical protein